MTYRKNLVCVIKVNGKVLRENNETVTLPFGCEYSVLVKNLDSRRALIKVSVDGQDATDGTRLIVPANGEVELERFIRNGNLSTGNRFRFVERSAAIEQHRGVGAEDGIVRVEAWAEVVIPQFVHTYLPPQPRRRWSDEWLTKGCFGNTGGDGEALRSRTSYSSNVAANMLRQSSFTAGAGATMDSALGEETQCFAALNDAGITVAGSESHQQFRVGEYFPVEAQSTVLVLKLRGAVGNVRAERPVTVEVKPKCTSCGRQNRATSKFCTQCGTALVII